MKYIVGIITVIILWLIWSYFQCKRDLNNAINILASRKKNTVMIGCDVRSAIRYFIKHGADVRSAEGQYFIEYKDLFIQIYEHKGFTFLSTEDFTKQ